MYPVSLRKQYQSVSIWPKVIILSYHRQDFFFLFFLLLFLFFCFFLGGWGGGGALCVFFISLSLSFCVCGIMSHEQCFCHFGMRRLVLTLLLLTIICPKISITPFNYLLMCLKPAWMHSKKCRPWSEAIFCVTQSRSRPSAQSCPSQYLGWIRYKCLP